MEHQPLSPIHRQRKTTNKPFLCIFLATLFLWISLVIYAYCAGDVSKIAIPSNVKDIFKNFFTASRILIVFGFVILNACYTMLTFVFCRYVKNITYFILFAIWAPLAHSLMEVSEHGHLIDYYEVGVSVINIILTYILISEYWFHIPEKILKESCKMILFLPSAFIFSVVWFASILVLICVGLSVHFYLMTLSAGFLIAFNAICLLWFSAMFACYGEMVLNGTFATWFWSKNKKEVNGATVLRWMIIIARYHTGTMAHAMSIIGLAQILFVMLKHVCQRFKEGVNGSFVLFLIYNLLEPVVFRDLIYGFMIACPSTGHDFYDSVKHAFDVLVKFPRRNLLSTKVMEFDLILIAIIILLLATISIGIYAGFSFVNKSQTEVIQEIILIMLTLLLSAFTIVPLIITLLAAFNTTLHCFFEDLHSNEDSDEKTYAMSADLQSVIVNTGPPEWFRNCQTCCGTIRNVNYEAI